MPVSTGGHERGCVVQEALVLVNQLPPTLKIQITSLEGVEAMTRQLTQIFGQTLAQGWTRETRPESHRRPIV